MKKTTLAAVLAGSFFAAPMASADILGANADVGYWYSGLSGDFTQGGTTADLEDDFGLDAGSSKFANVHFEHPVPLIPNVRVGYAQIKESGKQALGGGFDGIAGGTDVETDLTMEQVDATAYYEILDNIVSVDLGLTLRALDVEVDVQGGGSSSNNKLKGVVPLVYAAASGSLPFTGISAGAEVNGVGYSGDSFMDASAYVQYDVSVMELRGGYRQMSIDFEDDESKIDVDLSGPYISLGVDF